CGKEHCESNGFHSYGRHDARTRRTERRRSRCGERRHCVREGREDHAGCRRDAGHAGSGGRRSGQVVERGAERIVVEGNVAEFQLVIMREFLERTFHLSESNTTIRTEILAGFTTFMTMSYII